jgi:5-formyltetrahydrofolate cyclo-ligase
MIAYPRVESADAPLSFRLVREESDWEAGPHRIRQPGAHTPAVRPALILMPLLAFDRAGRRLGQGGGYYDRTLAAMPDVRTVGLAWSVQETDDIPTESWDRPLNAIITEKEWIEP